MCALNGLFVDRVDFLPQVLRGRSDERCSRIDVPGSLENTGPDCGEDRLYVFDDTVVERMHGARRLRFADAACDQRLDVARFDFDVDNGPIADEIERLREGWNARSIRQWELLELRGRELDYGLLFGLKWVPGVNHRIVVNDDNSVVRGVDIQLYAIGAELDRPCECSDRVLGMSLVRAPVSDSLRGVVAFTDGQAFLSVVALCSMSAKL